jgi:hypothetical protein
MNHTYTFYNFTGSGGSGAVSGFYIYRDGTTVYTDPGGSMGWAQYCKELIFINDSVGFAAVRSGGFSTYLMKTSNSGVTWTSIGSGIPDYFGMYPVNANYVYLVTQYGTALAVTRCSDIEPPVMPYFIDDPSIDDDIYKTDTIMGNSLCAIDSLRIFVMNGTDTVTYHINIHSMPVGIADDLSLENKYTVYPNPSAGFFRISDELNEIKDVNLLTLSGQLVKSYDPAAVMEHVFPVNTVSNGFYLVKINTTEKTLFLKLLINNQ